MRRRSAPTARIVTGRHDMVARIWDATSGAEILALEGHTGVIQSATFSPDSGKVRHRELG